MESKEILSKIMELRHIESVISNFIEIDLSEEGRAHTSYSILETGRLGSGESELGRGTHLQNVPGEKPPTPESAPYHVNVRKMFTADEGMELVEVDKSQGENRIVAWLAGEERQKEVFRKGGDIHQFNADNLKTNRQYAKTRTHGWNYGLGKRKKKVETEEDRARLKYFQTFPKIAQWHEQVLWEVAKKRVLVNPFGRRRMFFGRVEWEFDFVTKKPVKPIFNETIGEALAFLGQSTLVDDVNRGLIELFYRGEPWLQLLHHGHDSILGQTWKAKVPEALQLMKECMEKEFLCGDDLLVIPVECMRGEIWGEMREVKM